MKRSFYALFVLLAAISGPLVVAPKAISRQDAALSTSDKAFEDRDQESDDEDKPRTLQEANQPQCIFSFDFGSAPEDLIVLPEDYNYEIYGETDYCEMEQFASNPLIQEKAQAESNSTSFDANSDLPANPSDFLCLPFAEPELNWQAWDGPAIAGVETQPSAEELECELAAARFHEEELARQELVSQQLENWTANLIHKAIYTLTSTISHTASLGESRVISGIRSWDEFQSEKATQAFAYVFSTARISFERLQSLSLSVSQVVEAKEVAMEDRRYPAPPYCECWANPAQQIDPVAEAVVAPIEGGLAEGFGGWSLSESSPELLSGEVSNSQEGNRLEFDSLSSDALPKCSETMQNDATSSPLAQSETVAPQPVNGDFEYLKSALDATWQVLQERAQTLDRWSKEYDFEPLLPTITDKTPETP